MRKNKNKKRQRRVRVLVTFNRRTDSRRRIAIKMAMADQPTWRIMEVTKLTQSQVTYALAKGRERGHYAHTFRQQWRMGTSPLYEQFMIDNDRVMDAEIDRNIEIVIEHPTPETVKI